MRTTLDIDDPILRELKRLRQREGKSMGRLVSDLLAQALATRLGREPVPMPFRWTNQDMRPRIKLRDKDTLLDAQDDAAR